MLLWLHFGVAALWPPWSGVVSFSCLLFGPAPRRDPGPTWSSFSFPAGFLFVPRISKAEINQLETDLCWSSPLAWPWGSAVGLLFVAPCAPGRLWAQLAVLPSHLLVPAPALACCAFSRLAWRVFFCLLVLPLPRVRCSGRPVLLMAAYCRLRPPHNRCFCVCGLRCVFGLCRAAAWVLCERR